MLYITMWDLSPARLFSCGHTTPARLTAGPSLLALTPASGSARRHSRHRGPWESM